MRRKLLAVSVALAGVLAVASPARGAIDNPVAVWQMNERAGSPVMDDSSGNGIDGVIGTGVFAGPAVAPATGSRTPGPTRRPPTPGAWSRWHTTTA
jgi:hypothetical protein